MKLKNFIKEVEMERYSNNFKNGDHKDGSYKNVRVVDKHLYNYYDMADLNKLIENGSPLLEREITHIEPYIASHSRYGATAGILIFVKGDNKNE